MSSTCPGRVLSRRSHISMLRLNNQGSSGFLSVNKCRSICFLSTVRDAGYLCYAPGSNYWGHIVFILSVCLSSTLIFAVTFEPWDIETSYLIDMHTPLIKPWQKSQWPFDLDFDHYAKKTFFRFCCSLGHSVSQTHCFSTYEAPFRWHKSQWPCELLLTTQKPFKTKFGSTRDMVSIKT